MYLKKIKVLRSVIAIALCTTLVMSIGLSTVWAAPGIPVVMLGGTALQDEGVTVIDKESQVTITAQEGMAFYYSLSEDIGVPGALGRYRFSDEDAAYGSVFETPFRMGALALVAGKTGETGIVVGDDRHITIPVPESANLVLFIRTVGADGVVSPVFTHTFEQPPKEGLHIDSIRIWGIQPQ